MRLIIAVCAASFMCAGPKWFYGLLFGCRCEALDTLLAGDEMCAGSSVAAVAATPNDVNEHLRRGL